MSRDFWLEQAKKKKKKKKKKWANNFTIYYKHAQSGLLICSHVNSTKIKIRQDVISNFHHILNMPKVAFCRHLNRTKIKMLTVFLADIFSSSRKRGCSTDENCAIVLNMQKTARILRWQISEKTPPDCSCDLMRFSMRARERQKLHRRVTEIRLC